MSAARTREISLPINEEDYSDMPLLVEETIVLHEEQSQQLPSSLTRIIQSRSHRSEKPSVVAFECLNAVDTNVPCIICMDILHDKTGEKIRLSKCCHCAIHLTCTYKWLANQYTRGVPRETWSCPHCRTPVKDLANNPFPCMLCGKKELHGSQYYEPIAQSTPCCEVAIHQQCLYRYINFQFTEKRFPCPGCMTILSANRTLALHMDTGELNVAEMNLAGL